MTLPAAAAGVQGGAALAAALAAAAVLLLGHGRRRALAMPAALLLAAAALVPIAGSQIEDAVSGRAAYVAGGAGAAVVVLVALALAFRRWPAAFVGAAVFALPFRIPLTVGGETANLLLPLYGVIAAGVLARLLSPGPGAGGRRAAVEWAMAGVVVLYAAQSLYSTDAEAAVKDVCLFYVPFAVLLRLLLDVPWTSRVVRLAFGVTLGLAVVCAGVGLAEWATRHLLLANEKVLFANELKPYFRVNSLFFDPNIYGRFLALAMVMVAAVMLWTPRHRTLWACAFLLGLLWAGLVPSLSESSFGSLAAGLTVLAVLRWRSRAALLAGAGAVACGAVVVALAPSAVGIEERSFDGIDKATSGRATLVSEGVEMARERPLAGFGSGSFAERYRERKNLLSPRSPAESHTIPVTVAAEQGVLGLAAYLLLLGTALVLVLRGASARMERAAIAGAFGALVLHTLVYAAFLEDPITWALLAAAIAVRRGGEARPAPAAAPAERRRPVAAAS